MDALTLRLQESSAVQQAAEGLTPEQRMLVREREITAMIAQLETEQKDIRDLLKQHYLDTGELVETDAYKMDPKPKQIHEYDVKGMLKQFPNLHGLFRVGEAAITLALKSGLIEESQIENLRTTTTRLDWGVKAVKK